MLPHILRTVKAVAQYLSVIFFWFNTFDLMMEKYSLDCLQIAPERNSRVTRVRPLPTLCGERDKWNKLNSLRCESQPRSGARKVK